MTDLNIVVVTHGLTLRLLLMRYFQLSVQEFEQSYNSQNAKLVVMDRIIDDSGKEFFRLDEAAKEALNLKGDVSNEHPVYWRGDALDRHPYDLED
jgi:broad specificity phosphatase PhoE